ncbi:MAG: YdeI/OmpD-associated family protein [Chloroflexota bacterium]
MIAADIKAAFEKDPVAWKRFRRFPIAYRRIRIAFVEGARGRPAEFRRRLANLVRKSAKNEQFGMVREWKAPGRLGPQYAFDRPDELVETEGLGHENGGAHPCGRLTTPRRATGNDDLRSTGAPPICVGERLAAQ